MNENIDNEEVLKTHTIDITKLKRDEPIYIGDNLYAVKRRNSIIHIYEEIKKPVVKIKYKNNE